MKMARRIVFHACSTISIALILLAYPMRARQSQVANSNDLKASVTGRITTVSGDGATNVLPGATVKLIGPPAGLAPQSTVTDAEGRYEFTHVAAGAYTLEASADGFKTWSTTITSRTTRPALTSSRSGSVPTHRRWLRRSPGFRRKTSGRSRANTRPSNRA